MTAEADEGRWNRRCTASQEKESATFPARLLCNWRQKTGKLSVCFRGIWLTPLSRGANLKSWPVRLVWKLAISDVTLPSYCFGSLYQPWKYIIDTESSGGPSCSLSHKHTYAHTPLASLNQTPHNLSKHVGAVSVCLMAIYCVLYASH